jgi:hypothetical protein
MLPSHPAFAHAPVRPVQLHGLEVDLHEERGRSAALVSGSSSLRARVAELEAELHTAREGLHEGLRRLQEQHMARVGAELAKAKQERESEQKVGPRPPGVSGWLLYKHDASPIPSPSHPPSHRQDPCPLHRCYSRCQSQLRHLPPFLHHHGRPPGLPPEPPGVLPALCRAPFFTLLL